LCRRNGKKKSVDQVGQLRKCRRNGKIPDVGGMKGKEVLILFSFLLSAVSSLILKYVRMCFVHAQKLNGHNNERANFVGR
jgi:hypothetical protein